MMREAYCESECTVLTSRDEGFGRTVVESILAGTPCIIAGNGGAAQWLSAFAPEWVVSDDDPLALASAIGHVLANQSEARSLVLELQGQVFERFAMKTHSLRISEIYDSLVPRAN
jgi:glycosyltransferase involved in cell wall biosynthesis